MIDIKKYKQATHFDNFDHHVLYCQDGFIGHLPNDTDNIKYINKFLNFLIQSDLPRANRGIYIHKTRKEN